MSADLDDSSPEQCVEGCGSEAVADGLCEDCFDAFGTPRQIRTRRQIRFGVEDTDDGGFRVWQLMSPATKAVGETRREALRNLLDKHESDDETEGGEMA